MNRSDVPLHLGGFWLGLLLTTNGVLPVVWTGWVVYRMIFSDLGWQAIFDPLTWYLGGLCWLLSCARMILAARRHLKTRTEPERPHGSRVSRIDSKVRWFGGAKFEIRP